MFEHLLNKLVTVVYQDIPSPRAVKGRVIQVTPDFIAIRTYYNIINIRASAIISVKEGL